MKKTFFITFMLIIIISLSFVGVVVGKNNISKGPAPGKELSSDFKEFEFKAKEIFTSRMEVSEELARLSSEFKKHTEGCSDEYIKEQLKKIKPIEEKLKEELKKYPTDPNSLLLHEFNVQIEYIYDDNYRIQLSKEIPKQRKEQMQKIYERSLELKEAYEKNEIPLQEAYDELLMLCRNFNTQTK